MAHYYWHKVNGTVYNTIGLADAPGSMDEYRQMVRRAYGSLRGVTFGECS